MPFHQRQINPQVDDPDTIVANAAPNVLVSIIQNSPTSWTLNFAPPEGTQAPIQVGGARLTLPPKKR
jgi:hypothetical protein